MNRREFVGMSGLAAIAGCVGAKCERHAKFAMNASTLRGYNLSLLDQVKAKISSIATWLNTHFFNN